MLGTFSIPIVHFDLPPDVILLGAITGISYALFGLGLTLTYQSSRVINFAQGAIGNLPQVLVAVLVLDHGYGYWTAVVVALLIAAASGALLEVGVIRRLARAPRLIVLVATIGAAQLLVVPAALSINIGHTNVETHQYPLPFKLDITFGNLHLNAGHLMVLVLAPVIVVLLTLFLRGTYSGMASRAIAENEEAAELAGVPVRRISLLIWTIAGLLAGVAAILFGPAQPVLSTAVGVTSYTGNSDLLLRGLGAAMMGGLSSFPQVFAAGVGIGVTEALIRWNFPTSGNSSLVILVIIVISLLARRDLRQMARGGEESSWSLAGSVRALPERVRRLPVVRRARAVLFAGLGAFAIILPLTTGPPKHILFTAILIYMLIALSLVILTGWAGQVTLGQFTFVALGAMVGGRMQQLGYPLFGSVAFAVAAGVVAALVVGLPALRIRGLFLAVTTLAFAVFVNSFLIRQSWFVHVVGGSTSLELRRPTGTLLHFRSERTFYYVVLAVLVLAMIVVNRLRHTGIRRNFEAVRDNEPMASALAVSPAATKLTAFVVSGAIASLAGCLYAMLIIDFSNANFADPALSLGLVSMVILGGATSITGAILGAGYVRGLPYFFHSPWVSLLTSGAGLLVVLLFLPGGLAALAFRIRDWVVRRLVGNDAFAALAEPSGYAIGALQLDAGPDDSAALAAVAETARAVGLPALATTLSNALSNALSNGNGAEPVPPLEVRDVNVRFGGLAALNDVSIRVGRGEIIGLIGPNGAGKTTLFDVLSGLTAPTSGIVLLHGQDVTDLPPEQRASLGLGRSFQQSRIFDELTVVESFQVALERSDPTELVPSFFGLPPSRASERHKLLRAHKLIERLRLGSFAETPVKHLSTGTRRIAELGCAIALGADVLLLDEPTGGIAQREVEAFTPVLRQIRDYLNASMVVVAHDIPMITGLVDRIYVLSSGEIIAEGPPSLIHTDPRVAAVYLGTEETPAPPARRRRRARV